MQDVRADSDSEMVAYLMFCQDVIDALRSDYGLRKVSLEYPGCIVVHQSEFEYWYGDTNDTFGASMARKVTADDGTLESEPMMGEYVDTGVSNKSRDVTEVARAIYASFIEDWKKRSEG